MIRVTVWLTLAAFAACLMVAAFGATGAVIALFLAVTILIAWPDRISPAEEARRRAQWKAIAEAARREDEWRARRNLPSIR